MWDSKCHLGNAKKFYSLRRNATEIHASLFALVFHKRAYPYYLTFCKRYQHEAENIHANIQDKTKPTQITTIMASLKANNNNNQGLFSTAREKIHTATKSQEEIQQEEWNSKSTIEKMKETSKEAFENISKTLDATDEPPKPESDGLLSGVADTTNNLLSQARETIHSATKSQEEVEREEWNNKTLPEKIQEKTPNSAEEAFAAVGSTIDAVATDVKTKFNERLEEGHEDKGEKQ